MSSGLILAGVTSPQPGQHNWLRIAIPNQNNSLSKSINDAIKQKTKRREIRENKSVYRV